MFVSRFEVMINGDKLQRRIQNIFFLKHYKLQQVYITLNGLAQWEGSFIQMLHVFVWVPKQDK